MFEEVVVYVGMIMWWIVFEIKNLGISDVDFDQVFDIIDVYGLWLWMMI